MRILIANPFGIGDVLFSLPLIYAIREIDVKGFVGYLCNRRTEELVRSWTCLDGVEVFEKDEFRAAWRRSKKEGFQLLLELCRTIRRERFDILLDLSLGWHYGLGAALAGIPKRVGFDFRNRGRFLTHRMTLTGYHNQPVAEYYLKLLLMLGWPIPPKVRATFDLPESVGPEVEAYLSSRGLSQDRLIAIVPGGGASWGPHARFKQWPPDRFAQVADRLSDRHPIKILLIGDSQEASLCRKVAAAMTRQTPTLVVQVPSLLLLAGLLKRCELVIGNDSGPMHLAASIGTKTVALFGPVDGSVYGPLRIDPLNPSHRIVAKGLACRPCYQGFRFPPCPWDNACLRQLEASEVVSAAESLLRG